MFCLKFTYTLDQGWATSLGNSWNLLKKTYFLLFWLKIGFFKQISWIFLKKLLTPELDSVPIIKELSSVVDHLTNDKAPGSDNHLINTCSSARLLPLHLNQWWQKGKVPQEICDAKIIYLYKNKGEWTDIKRYFPLKYCR